MSKNTVVTREGWTVLDGDLTWKIDFRLNQLYSSATVKNIRVYPDQDRYTDNIDTLNLQRLADKIQEWYPEVSFVNFAIKMTVTRSVTKQPTKVGGG